VPTYMPVAPGAMMRRVGSNEKARRMLGFQAAIGLRQGLEEVVRGVRA